MVWNSVQFMVLKVGNPDFNGNLDSDGVNQPDEDTRQRIILRFSAMDLEA
jgi:hypothetical protein